MCIQVKNQIENCIRKVLYKSKHKNYVLFNKLHKINQFYNKIKIALLGYIYTTTIPLKEITKIGNNLSCGEKRNKSSNIVIILCYVYNLAATTCHY